VKLALVSAISAQFGDSERKLPFVFLAASVFVGVIAIIINPPLRGPDESVHFIRAYAIAQGEFMPRAHLERRERGVFLPPPLNTQFRYFDQMRESPPPSGHNYGQVFRVYFNEAGLLREPVATFVPYGGAEAYTPVAYLPYAAAALVAKAAGLEFLGYLYLMRIAGLVIAALITAHAIALAPNLKWTVFCTAMLPTALYQRSVINVDGALLATTLLVIALCLRSLEAPSAGAWQRSFWTTVTSLTKPSQVAFALLESMRLRKWKTQGVTSFLVITPGLLLALAWSFASLPDLAAWRTAETDSLPALEFDPLWKLQFLFGHPLTFLSASIMTLDYSAELWRQAIGVFGWLDVEMRSWTYALISLLLALTFCARLDFDRNIRQRIALVAGATILAYYLLVSLLFYVTFTPSDAGRIYGVQGRYFIVLIPLFALITSAVINRKWDTMGAMAAIACAIISAGAMLEAVWRVHWSS
jgi:uncharacterized membrane protein